jgi:hypothetical protein
MLHLLVKSLPQVIQAQLNTHGYQKADIPVRVTDSVRLNEYGNAGKGSRGFTTIINLDTKEVRTEFGSWGGANPFESRAVDHDETPYALPVNGVVIQGAVGGYGTFGTLYIPQGSPIEIPKELPVTLTDVEQAALYCHHSIKGGQYRREELRRFGVPQSVVDSLVERGFLKRNTAGAIQITTLGKNSRDGKSYWPSLVKQNA